MDGALLYEVLCHQHLVWHLPQSGKVNLPHVINFPHDVPMQLQLVRSYTTKRRLCELGSAGPLHAINILSWCGRRKDAVCRERRRIPFAVQTRAFAGFARFFSWLEETVTPNIGIWSRHSVVYKSLPTRHTKQTINP